MTAVPIPAPVRVHMPNPGQLAASVARMALRSVPTGPDVPAELPPARERRGPALTGAAAVSQARWADCSRGAHVWVETPLYVVCRHCPTPQHQAERVAAARQVAR